MDHVEDELSSAQQSKSCSCDAYNGSYHAMCMNGRLGSTMITELHRLGLPFHRADPESWFQHVERLCGSMDIRCEAVKYHFVAESLEARVAEEVADILSERPSPGKYRTLKSGLIGRLRASRERSLRELMECDEMGAMSPTEFLRHLRCLASGSLEEDALKLLWMAKLPREMRRNLVKQRTLSLEQLPELAEALLEIPAFEIGKQESGSLEEERVTSMIESKLTEALAPLQREIDEIKKKMTTCRCGPRLQRAVSSNLLWQKSLEELQNNGADLCYCNIQKRLREAEWYEPFDCISVNSENGDAEDHPEEIVAVDNACCPADGSSCNTCGVLSNMALLNLDTPIDEAIPCVQLQAPAAGSGVRRPLVSENSENEALADETGADASQPQCQSLKDNIVTYIRRVKYTFIDQPLIFNRFVDIMKECKANVDVIPASMIKINNLFKGHPELVSGFNDFLPQNLKIEEQDDEQ